MNNTIKQAVVSVEKLEEWDQYLRASKLNDDPVVYVEMVADEIQQAINSAEEVEPHAYTWIDDGKGSTKDLPLYLHPAPPTERLSDEEIEGIFKRFVRKFYNAWGYEEGLHSNDRMDFARAIEHKITEKNK